MSPKILYALKIMNPVSLLRFLLTSVIVKEAVVLTRQPRIKKLAFFENLKHQILKTSKLCSFSKDLKTIKEKKHTVFASIKVYFSIINTVN